MDGYAADRHISKVDIIMMTRMMKDRHSDLCPCRSDGNGVFSPPIIFVLFLSILLNHPSLDDAMLEREMTVEIMPSVSAS